ncbi:NADH:ubiquinone oxidoreductase subunit L [Lysobacter concretionis Ko07 = DSM 16239]|uniref:NADH:ubiquinone oxidoreductase subunit L n=1 Tax=Lysobacter concretionis Ko07 = DSM 16239 TaxID=1122185 RepID=A0A0A0ELY2_9GAMM|nr:MULTISPECIES: NADH-quinone oxidoreductase subunit L [Lysobacter]KGM52016.1 NADH:ubiquinone oxidoreductase subunit L [Lysobacter concretionis Ko07 = DSM 16239]QOD90248.1 NADH-quinone oxidoreductase subunit L [Lysobacter sp. CW239]
MEFVVSKTALLAIVLAPLVGTIVAGFFGRRIGRAGAHSVTILGVAISCALSGWVLWQLVGQGAAPFNENIYTWFKVGGFEAHIGFMVDKLTAMMMVVVTFVSLLVHLYSIGYMADDDGYQRFFSYISLFTFAMLMLVMSNNFLQLFFGWEGVGLVSYLLIGFWFKRPTAVFANFKAFMVNRVGDFGFILGIAAVVWWFGSLDYATVFANAPSLAGEKVSILAGHEWSVATVICIFLFIGAMGKSAQVPLHVWLPDSMEGPTPISALIHAATMVTAGIFMVARMSPLFEFSETALQFVLFIGATTAFFTGLIGMVQNDIKRVVAYSTLSQLGYMTVALGVSAYSAAVFHLMTHAFFKALLFLAAGSVIIGMHHVQDMRQMGGLRKYMPVTYWTMLIGTLALVGTPFFSGFYSKDTIIEAAHHASLEGGWIAQYAYWAVLLGAFVTAFYSFRLLYLTFHGKERFRDAPHAGGHDDHGQEGGHEPHEPHESPWTVTVPLVLLAIPSILIGFFTAGPMLFGTNWSGEIDQLPFFLGAIDVVAARDVVAALAKDVWHGPVAFALHGFKAPTFWLAFAGFVVATVMYLWKPELPAKARRVFAWPIRVLEDKYGFDALWIGGLAGGSVKLGQASRVIDSQVIDGAAVNGSVRVVELIANLSRRIQSGYLYHYAFVMILGLIVLLAALIRNLI